jgi:hypothetical protein
MVDLQLILYTAMGTAVLAAIALIGSNWSTIVGYFVMFSEERAARRGTSMQPVYIPVSRYGMDAAGMDEGEDDAPDIDAPNAGIPHFKRDMSDSEWIAYMAVARGKNGKHRFSANQIHTAIGGDRNAVLARVKELRATPAPAEYMQPDGTRVPASHPVTGQRRPA